MSDIIIQKIDIIDQELFKVKVNGNLDSFMIRKFKYSQPGFSNKIQDRQGGK